MGGAIFIPEYIYDVALNTQLGIKKGIMRLSIEQGKINGCLDILRHSEPLYGEITTTGDCTLQGKIKTLMRFINYTATGHIDRNNVQLLLISRGEQFEMTGTARIQEAEQNT